MSRALVAIALLAFGAGCGGAGAEPPPAVPRAHEPAAASREPARPRMTVEYVVIRPKWVQKNVPAPPAEVSAWYETPEGRAAAPPVRREMAFDDKKKADAALARLQKNEPFEKVLAASLDVVSQPKSSHVEAAYDKLALGELSGVVKAESGLFFVVKKERPGDEALERAYRKAKAPEIAERLAADILQRLKKRDEEARPAIAESVGALLGDRAVADPDRPSAVLVDEGRLRIARLPPKAKQALERMLQEASAGDVLPTPIAEADAIVIARAVAAR